MGAWPWFGYVSMLLVSTVLGTKMTHGEGRLTDLASAALALEVEADEVVDQGVSYVLTPGYLQVAFIDGEADRPKYVGGSEVQWQGQESQLGLYKLFVGAKAATADAWKDVTGTDECAEPRRRDDDFCCHAVLGGVCQTGDCDGGEYVSNQCAGQEPRCCVGGAGPESPAGEDGAETGGQTTLSRPLPDAAVNYASIEASEGGMAVFVCGPHPAAGSGGTVQCGSATITDQYDTSVWWEGATHIPFTMSRTDLRLRTGGTFLDSCLSSFRGVFHTTEGSEFTPSTTSFYGHSSAPHFTIYCVSGGGGDCVTYQHLPINVASRALANPDGGVQTNRQCAIQVEIVGKAKESGSFSADLRSAIKEWVAWVSDAKDIPLKAATVFDVDDAYGTSSTSRFGDAYWNSFTGWCGHQHVPENSHWDPGLMYTNETVDDYFGLEPAFCRDDTTGWGDCGD